MLDVKRITRTDDLATLTLEINGAIWDSENDLSVYTVEGLRNYLSSNTALFLACFIENQLAGIASGNLLLKPYDTELWLYVNEVDVAEPHRRKGVATALMREFFAIASERNCREVWVGSEVTNTTANKFYRSLTPSEIQDFTGYTFKPTK
jgi:ribosomal protein S18 acetylase RimI-like enzyme